MLLFGDITVPLFIAFAFTALLAFAYHEFAHALVADRLGDDTPRRFGRMTLNPFVHLDLFGTLMLLLAGFGWASTPVNPRNLRGNPRTAHAIVAIAGPIANALMAVLWGLPLMTGLVEMSFAPDGAILPTVYQVCYTGVLINLVLFAFNLMPIPPLDGFTILVGLLPVEMAYRLEPLRQYGTIILLLVIFLLPRIGLNVIDLWLSPVLNNVMPILLGRG
ncbi:MAG: site-2 protease family protein [Chloroflexi bacterium]|jgi:Zn-dependent protease|nr:site-2 protease family protein [Chloroflexota bacterium]